MKKNLPLVQMSKCDKSAFWSIIGCAWFCLHFLHNPINTSLPFLCMLHKVCSELWLQNAVTKCQSVKTKAARRCSIITGRAINHRASVFAPRFLISEKTLVSVVSVSQFFPVSSVPETYAQWLWFSALLEFQLSQCFSKCLGLESPPRPQCLPRTKVVVSVLYYGFSSSRAKDMFSRQNG